MFLATTLTLYFNLAETEYLSFPVEAFSFSDDSFTVHIGANFFSEDIIRLDIHSDSTVIIGEVRMSDQTGMKREEIMKLVSHIAVVLLTVLITSLAVGQSADQTVKFTVRTTTPGGNFSPRNIGAIWIEDSNGQFVKTLKRWADRRKQYLYT